MREWNCCPACSSSRNRMVYHQNPGVNINGTVVKCLDCRLLFKIPEGEDFDATDCNATHFSDPDASSFVDSSPYMECPDATRLEHTEILDFILDATNRGEGKLLDLGCGPGKFLELAESKGFTCFGVEAAEGLAKEAKSRTNGEILVDDVLSHDFKGQKLDVITLLDLVEHLQDPVETLRQQKLLLSSEGVLAVFTPNHVSFIAQTARWLRFFSFGIIKNPCN